MATTMDIKKMLFPKKINFILRPDQEDYATCVARRGNNGFRILDIEQFKNNVLAKLFTSDNMMSFKRQLNMYSFKKVEGEANTWMHEDFIVGDWDQIERNVQRKKTNKKKKTKAKKNAAAKIYTVQELPAIEGRYESRHCEAGLKPSGTPSTRDCWELLEKTRFAYTERSFEELKAGTAKKTKFNRDNDSVPDNVMNPSVFLYVPVSHYDRPAYPAAVKEGAHRKRARDRGDDAWEPASTPKRLCTDTSATPFWSDLFVPNYDHHKYPVEANLVEEGTSRKRMRDPGDHAWEPTRTPKKSCSAPPFPPTPLEQEENVDDDDDMLDLLEGPSKVTRQSSLEIEFKVDFKGFDKGVSSFEGKNSLYSKDLDSEEPPPTTGFDNTIADDDGLPDKLEPVTRGISAICPADMVDIGHILERPLRLCE